MNDLEERLFEAGQVTPTERLDRSVERMIQRAEFERTRRGGLRNPILAAVSGCVVGLVVGVGASTWLGGQEPVPTNEGARVIIIEPTPELERWINGHESHSNRGFFDRQHDELVTIYSSGEAQTVESSSL